MMMTTYNKSLKLGELLNRPVITEQRNVYCVLKSRQDELYAKFLEKNKRHVFMVTEEMHYLQVFAWFYDEIAFTNPKVETLFQITFGEIRSRYTTVNRSCTWLERINDLMGN
jgi:hypothetical protein